MKISAMVLASLLFSMPAVAHDHQHPNFDAWYQGLQRPDTKGMMGYEGGSFSCCNKLDCHPTEAETRGNNWWARAVVTRNGEEIKLNWLQIPNEKVIRNKDNPTGYPVLCFAPSWKQGSQTEVDPVYSTIYCFIPEAQI